MKSPILHSGILNQVFWITRRIAQGLFVTETRAKYLQKEGITHILNVGESESIVRAGDFGFQIVHDIPVQDLHRIPDDVALSCLDAIHAMLRIEGSRVYIHCVAGQNRSPTILWLYFIACGMPFNEAKVLISSHTLDAIPGHPRLIDDRLIATVSLYGSKNFIPLHDPNILIPAD